MQPLRESGVLARGALQPRIPGEASGATSPPRRHRPGGPCGWTAPQFRLGSLPFRAVLAPLLPPTLGVGAFGPEFPLGRRAAPDKVPYWRPLRPHLPRGALLMPARRLAIYEPARPLPTPSQPRVQLPAASGGQRGGGGEGAGRENGGARVQASSGAVPVGGGQGEGWGRGGWRERWEGGKGISAPPRGAGAPAPSPPPP